MFLIITPLQNQVCDLRLSIGSGDLEQNITTNQIIFNISIMNFPLIIGNIAATLSLYMVYSSLNWHDMQDIVVPIMKSLEDRCC